MVMVIMNLIPWALLIAVAVQFSCQIFKFFYYSFKEKRLDLKFLVTPGGIPSAHSAFAASITTAVAVRTGLGSDLFAVSFVFAVIVMFDALKLRGEVQSHAVLLNRLKEKMLPGDSSEPLSEMVGHSALEILIGVVIGVGVSLPLAYFLPQF